jgi:hypothetical protein
MNYHTLSGSRRKNQYKFLVLATFVLLGISGISNSFAQESDSITLTTNKNSYLPGDVVQLGGVVTGQPTFGIALEVIDSDGTVILNRTVQADQNGNFAIQFKIPSTATSGTFSVYASALVNGFHITQTKVFAATVPEFGQTAGEVLGFSIVFIILVFAMSTKLQNLKL